MGNAYNTDNTAMCAEDLDGDWYWWDWESGVWTLDETARMTCI